MLKDPSEKQHAFEMVTLEELVPKDHLLRLIDRHIDFSFIRTASAHLYSADNGRPAIDPVQLFKLLFIGYLFGVRSERRLVQEVQVNVAYRWFLGLGLTDKVMDASTLSQNRRRRFAGTQIEQTIFDQIVEQAIAAGLIGGRVLYTDSTHLKASANKNKFEAHQVDIKPAQYLEQLEQAITEDRAEHGKKPLPPSDKSLGTKELKVSKTDPDSGYMTRDNKPQGFFYLDHRTVDGVHSLIVDTHVTPGNVHDSQPYIARLDRVRERFDLDVGAVGLDAGYFTSTVCEQLVQRDIYAVMGYRGPVAHRPGTFYKREYIYDAKADTYTCPVGQVIAYTTTNRVGYREYHSQASQCAQCPSKNQCTQSQNNVKVLVRHVWEDSKDLVNANRLTETGKRIYKRRKETVERSFADAKELHGHRYARFRGLAKVRAQSLLAATCQNMKKMARLLAAAALRLIFTPKPTQQAHMSAFTRLFSILTQKVRPIAALA
jgi:transposase